MRILILAGVSLAAALVSPGLAAAEPKELPPSHSVQPQLYATGFAFAEGPAFDTKGNFFTVNYRELGTIGRITPDGHASIWCRLPTLAPLEGRMPQANGLKIDRFDRVIVADAGAGRVLRIDPEGKNVEVLAERYQGTRFNAVNDVALDAAMNIYFTDPGGSSLENPVGGVYRYEAVTRQVQRLAGDLAFPNGIAITPDQRYLCVAESQKYRVLRYALRPDGSVGPGEVLIDFPRHDHDGLRGGDFYPDGMVFDQAGRLYVAMWTGGVINVVDPGGGLLRQYDAGGSQATNCHFHGGSLYTTVAAKEAVFRLDLGIPGFDYRKP